MVRDTTSRAIGQFNNPESSYLLRSKMLASRLGNFVLVHIVLDTLSEAFEMTRVFTWRLIRCMFERKLAQIGF